MHGVEDILALQVDADAKARAEVAEDLTQLTHVSVGARGIDDHDHREFALNYRLVYIDNAAVGFAQ